MRYIFRLVVNKKFSTYFFYTKPLNGPVPKLIYALVNKVHPPVWNSEIKFLLLVIANNMFIKFLPYNQIVKFEI